jgi:hypothetical protein
MPRARTDVGSINAAIQIAAKTSNVSGRLMTVP